MYLFPESYIQASIIYSVVNHAFKQNFSILMIYCYYIEMRLILIILRLHTSTLLNSLIYLGDFCRFLGFSMWTLTSSVNTDHCIS